MKPSDERKISGKFPFPTASNPKQTTFANRDVATKIGGFGLCGRPVCCRNWLIRPNAMKLSIKMAKEQKLALDPDNLNGFCQQIKCCVGFECDPEKTQISNACTATPPRSCDAAGCRPRRRTAPALAPEPKN